MVEQTVTTDADGGFRVEGVPASSICCLLASHWDFTPQWLDGIRLPGDGHAMGIEMRLLRGGTIQGRVLDRRGVPVPTALVSVKRSYPECLERDYNVRCLLGSFTVTDAEGNFTLTRVRPGAHRIEVMATEGQLLTSETTPLREAEASIVADLVLED
jgi:hypothetical protein